MHYNRNLKDFKESKHKIRYLSYNMALEEKIRLEYDMKQRLESGNIQISNLRAELENVQVNLGDK